MKVWRDFELVFLQIIIDFFRKRKESSDLLLLSSKPKGAKSTWNSWLSDHFSRHLLIWGQGDIILLVHYSMITLKPAILIIMAVVRYNHTPIYRMPCCFRIQPGIVSLFVCHHCLTFPYWPCLVVLIKRTKMSKIVAIHFKCSCVLRNNQNSTYDKIRVGALV